MGESAHLSGHDIVVVRSAKETFALRKLRATNARRSKVARMGLNGAARQ